MSLRQRERNVVRPGRRRYDFDFYDLQFRHVHFLRLGRSITFGFVLVYALFDPLFTVIYPHRASFL
ncbi:MAG: hypothetical protein DMF59_19370 [Acidobacteria bacterium]|nr:MAG: hypothetical protein DMF59_19370 [Acidobacteriota bacterium]